MILFNEFEPFPTLVNSEFYIDFETFSKLVHEGNENVSTNKILGSLEILGIKNNAKMLGPLNISHFEKFTVQSEPP